MVTIRVSETGFVSGNAWETVGYEGDDGSRLIHTVFNYDSIDDSYSIGYYIKSYYLDKVVTINLDEDNNILIPKEFMSKSQKLWFQFFIKKDDNLILKSNPFHLNIESSVGPEASVILKPGANVCISVKNLSERDSIPRNQLAHGKLIRVSDVDGKVVYYSWDNDKCEWIMEIFGVGTIKIEDVEGLYDILKWKSL